MRVITPKGLGTFTGRPGVPTSDSRIAVKLDTSFFGKTHTRIPAAQVFPFDRFIHVHIVMHDFQSTVEFKPTPRIHNDGPLCLVFDLTNGHLISQDLPAGLLTPEHSFIWVGARVGYCPPHPPAPHAWFELYQSGAAAQAAVGRRLTETRAAAGTIEMLLLANFQQKQLLRLEFLIANADKPTHSWKRAETVP